MINCFYFCFFVFLCFSLFFKMFFLLMFSFNVFLLFFHIQKQFFLYKKCFSYTNTVFPIQKHFSIQFVVFVALIGRHDWPPWLAAMFCYIGSTLVDKNIHKDHFVCLVLDLVATMKPDKQQSFGHSQPWNTMWVNSIKSEKGMIYLHETNRLNQ